MPTGTVRTKGDQGMAADGAKLGTITEADTDDLLYFDNRKGFDISTDVKWKKTAAIGSYLIALNVKRS